MISKLSIRNFGTNRRLDIDLDRRITCLTGESYTGKSWAVRAVRWVSQNRPSGTSFIRWGSKKSVVTIQVGKHTISRRRGKAENSYHYDGRPLKAFGNNVPDLVQKALNLSDLNFQTQQEVPYGSGPLFWLALSPGEVARRLNRIVNLDLIDKTLGNLGKAVHRAKVELDVCRDRRDEARRQAESLFFVREMVEEWEGVKEASAKTEKLDKQVEDLGTLLDEIAQQQSIVDAGKSRLEHADKDLSELEALREAIIRMDKDCDALSDVLDEIERLEREKAEALDELKRAKDEYDEAMKGRCPLCGRKGNKHDDRPAGT